MGASCGFWEMDNFCGIYCRASGNVLRGNIVKNNYDGIEVMRSDYNEIVESTIVNM